MSKAREALARIAAIKDGTGSEFVEIDEARKIAREALAEPEAAPAAPYGQVTTHSQTGQQFFYRWPESPYLDSASECVTVYAAPPPKPSQAGPVQGEWISVEERLPEPNQAVVLLDVRRRENCDFERQVQAAGYLATWGGLPGHWSISGQRGMTLETFTHWMPLPPSPLASSEGQQPGGAK